MGCMSRPIDLAISSKYAVNGLVGIEKVVKSGDFIAIVGENDSKLAITENFTFDINQGEKIDSNSFFDQLYQENEDSNTVLGKYTGEFRIGLQIDGYIKKRKFSKNGSTVYLWLKKNNQFVAIVNDDSSEYFLNIVGENINAEKVINIIRE